MPPTPDVPPRPVEEGKIVYLKMAELHPFHTFREHPYKVQDDKAMDDLVGTITEHGIMTPATVRPEKDGKGYEIIAGHRRHHGGTRAGLEEMPCIVREMTDLEGCPGNAEQQQAAGRSSPQRTGKAAGFGGGGYQTPGGPARKMRKRRRPWVSSRWRLWVRNTT